MIDKKLLGEFRKKALAAYPDELMHTLWGRVEGDSIIIHHLRGVEQEATGDKVEAYVSDMVSPVASTPERYLGSIHSHPDCFEASPSLQDWHNAYVCGEHVFGIMAIHENSSGRFSTSVAWWEPRPFIDTIHPRIRKTWKTPKATSQSAPTLPTTPVESPAPSDVETASTSKPKTESATTR